MSEFKFLIDTNIVIGLEDNRPVDAGLTELTRRCSANGVRLFVDGALDDDIQRDTDLARRISRGSTRIDTGVYGQCWSWGLSCDRAPCHRHLRHLRRR